MTAPAISPAPWDLRSGEKWEIRSADRDQYGDHNSEVVVDAKGNVVAYISGFNDEGGNGQLLRAAPALRDALSLTEGALSALLKDVETMTDWTNQALGVERKAMFARILSGARAALKQAGAL